MNGAVTIVDYGINNIFGLRRALEHIGVGVATTAHAAEILNARRLILPGVGAFAAGMGNLAKRGLVEPVAQYAKSGRPLLGVCLGMQMLFDSSEEFGATHGLGLIRGKVAAIPATGADGTPHKVPHIGWARLLVPRGAKASPWRGTPLEGVEESEFYFVHSYAAAPDDARVSLAECDYDGRVFCAAVRQDNIWGTQFHPEKSGEAGLSILRRFSVTA
jgi:glutamine amidotransferase